MSAIVPKNYSPTLISEKRDLMQATQKNTQAVRKIASGSGDAIMDVADRLADKAFKSIMFELIILTAAAVTIIVVVYILFRPLINGLFSSILDTVNGISGVTTEALGTVTETLGTVIKTATEVIETVVETSSTAITGITDIITDTLVSGIEIVAGPPTMKGQYEDVGAAFSGNRLIKISSAKKHGFAPGDDVVVEFEGGELATTAFSGLTYEIKEAQDLKEFIIEVKRQIMVNASDRNNVRFSKAGVVGVIPTITRSVQQISYVVVGNPNGENEAEKKGVIKMIAGGVETVIETITNPTTGLIPTLMNTITAAVDVFKNVMSAAQNAFIDVINAIKTSIENVVSGIQDGIRYLVEPFLNTSYGIPAIARNLYEVVNMFSTNIAQVGTSVKDGVNSIKVAIENLGSSLGI